MKDARFALRKVICLVLLVLISSMVLFAQEKNRYGKYPGNKRNPNIDNYPKAIQILDSLKTNYYTQNRQHKIDGTSFNLSKEFLKEFACSYINSYMYYSSINDKGYYSRYFNESYPIGFTLYNQMKELPFPYGFLIRKKGLVLAKVIEDEILPRQYMIKQPPSLGYDYVLKAKVIEDIFDSCDEDTIYVRHSLSIEKEFNEYNDMLLLFTFKPRGTIQRPDSVQYVYLMGNMTEFMFVDGDVIYDPNKILLDVNIDSYEELKNKLLLFKQQVGIRK